MIWFDLVVVIIVVGAIIRGAISGLVMQLASLLGLIIGAIFAGQLADVVAPWLIEWMKVSDNERVVGVLSYVVAFLLIFLAIHFIGRLLQATIEAIKINSLNRLAGAAFCVVKWVFLLSIILNLVVQMDRNEKLIEKDIRENSVTYPLVLSTAQFIVPYLTFEWLDKIDLNINLDILKPDKEDTEEVELQEV